MPWTWIIIGGLFILYVIWILACLSGLRRIYKFPAPSNSVQPPVTVVVPVRNEAAHIGGLLRDLLEQDYPEQLFEVILSDDHSTDHTVRISKDVMEGFSNFRLLSLPDQLKGKKFAVEEGIRHATGNIILTTDGDCRVGSGWISGMVKSFVNRDTRMVLGSVFIDPAKGIIQTMQSLEFASLISIAAGTAGLGRPVLCNAANMAFYREDYRQFRKEADPHTPGGDDIFLMLWTRNKWPGGISFSGAPATVVCTRPAVSAREFMQQRIRWTSKSRFYRNADIILTAMLVYLVNASLMVSGILSIMKADWLFFFLGCFVLKALADSALLSTFLKYYGRRNLLWVFLPLGLIYFVYVSVIGLMGQVLPFSWKDRRIRPSKQLTS